MAPMRPTERPTRRDLDQLTDQIRPDLEDLFAHHGISQHDAERLLREALVRLSYQWDRIRNRTWWLLDTLEKAARALNNPTLEETGDDGTP